jgi:hypothetical protein
VLVPLVRVLEWHRRVHARLPRGPAVVELEQAVAVEPEDVEVSLS